MLIIPSLLKNNYKILIAAFVLITYTLGVYVQGQKSTQAKWDLATAQAIIKAREIENNNALLNNKIGAKYETGIKSIDDAYNSALASLQSATSDGVRLSPSTTSKPTCATSADELPKRNARLKLAREAELNTQRLISLQEWVQEFE
jgi:hypothetical protein